MPIHYRRKDAFVEMSVLVKYVAVNNQLYILLLHY